MTMLGDWEGGVRVRVKVVGRVNGSVLRSSDEVEERDKEEHFLLFFSNLRQ